jgi:Fe-S-cluster containining protein
VSADDDAVTRRDFERGLRFVNLSIANLRDDLLRLAAQVVALTEAVGARERVEEATPALVEEIRAADEHTIDRPRIGEIGDKYAVEPATPPCAELMPICRAACCRLSFALSTQDLDEGVIRWDYAQPYLIKQRESDRYCVHNDPASHGCTVHAQRPGTCRTYSCADDPRIWADFENRVLAAPIETLPLAGDPPDVSFDLHARARARQVALMFEGTSLRTR